jgi:hypothetical protein
MRAKAPPFDDRPDPDRGQTTLDFAVGMSIFLIAVAGVISFTPSLLEPFEGSGTEDTIVANRVASQLVEGTLAEPDEPYVLDKACTMAFFWPENVDGDADNDDDLNATNDGDIQSYGKVQDQPFWDGPGSCNFDPSLFLHQRVGAAGIAEDGSADLSRSPGMQIQIRGDNNSDGTTQLLCIDANNRSDTTKAEVIDPIVDADDTIGGPCDISGADQDIPFQAGQDPPEDTGSVVVARRIATIDGIRATVEVRVW